MRNENIKCSEGDRTPKSPPWARRTGRMQLQIPPSGLVRRHDARSFVSYLRMTYDPLFCVSVRRKEWAIHMKIGTYSKLVSYSYSLVLCIRYSYIFGSIVFCAITIVSLLMNERTANVRSAPCSTFVKSGTNTNVTYHTVDVCFSTKRNYLHFYLGSSL